MTQQEEVIVRMGMDTSGMQQGANRAQGIVEGFATKVEHRAVSMAKAFAVQYLIEAGTNFLNWWKNVASKQMAAVFEQQWKQIRTGDLFDFQRGLIRKDLEASRKAAVEKDKALTEAAKERVKLLTEFDKAGADRAEKRMTTEEKIKKTAEEIARLKKEIVGADISSNTTLEKTIALTRLQAQMDELERQNADEAAKKRADQLEKNEPLRKELSDKLATGKYNPELQRISQLEADARLSSLSGNIARARTDMNIANQIRSDIRSNILTDLRNGAAETPLQKTTREFLDSLAPIASSGEIPVAARIVDSD